MKSGITRWKMVPSKSLLVDFGARDRMGPLLCSLGQLDEVFDGDGRIGLKRRMMILPSVVVKTA